MWWGANEGMGWWMVFGGILMVVFWGGVIGLVVWGIRNYGRKEGGLDSASPLEIARHRYAQGEITREEFEEIKATLGSGGGAGP